MICVYHDVVLSPYFQPVSRHHMGNILYLFVCLYLREKKPIFDFSVIALPKYFNKKVGELLVHSKLESIH